MDILYSRVNKSKRRDPGSAADQLNPKGRAEILTPGSCLSYEVLPPRGLSTNDEDTLENVYESIQEVGLCRSDLKASCSRASACAGVYNPSPP